MGVPAHRIAFGEHLCDLRQERGWSSQEAFAHHIGMDRTYVSSIERGRRNPTLDVIVKIANGLGVPPGDLVSTIGAARS